MVAGPSQLVKSAVFAAHAAAVYENHGIVSRGATIADVVSAVSRIEHLERWTLGVNGNPLGFSARRHWYDTIPAYFRGLHPSELSFPAELETPLDPIRKTPGKASRVQVQAYLDQYAGSLREAYQQVQSAVHQNNPDLNVLFNGIIPPELFGIRWSAPEQIAELSSKARLLFLRAVPPPPLTSQRDWMEGARYTVQLLSGAMDERKLTQFLSQANGNAAKTMIFSHVHAGIVSGVIQLHISQEQYSHAIYFGGIGGNLYRQLRDKSGELAVIWETTRAMAMRVPEHAPAQEAALYFGQVTHNFEQVGDYRSAMAMRYQESAYWDALQQRREVQTALEHVMRLAQDVDPQDHPDWLRQAENALKEAKKQAPS